MPKGNKCAACGRSTAVFDRGAYHCKSCESIWWTSFDKPAAGEKRKGYACISCGKCTIHPLGTVASAKIWRCSTCAMTMVTPTAKCVPHQADTADGPLTPYNQK